VQRRDLSDDAAMRRLAILLAVACCSSPVKPAPQPPVTRAAAPLPVAAAQLSLADPQPPAFRLPGDVVPARYRLDLTIRPDGDHSAGKMHIDARVVRATHVVWLNARGLKVGSASLGGAPVRVLPGGDDFVGLAAPAELPPGPLAIDIEFDAPIDHGKSRGIYSEREGNDAYVYTFFEPIDARRAFPCFDEPSYKVPWQLGLTVPHGNVARANAPIARELDLPDGMKRVEFVESKPLPSYLVAFVVGPFEVIDGGTAGRASTPIAFVVPKGRAAELAYAKEVTPKVVTALEDYFDMPYPYGKLDVAVVPRYWGTMEHPGIVAMGQPLTLIRADQRTRQREQSYTNILAHELSHYWFGDYVTMAWWDDTWLNEALGEWSDLNITEAVAPAWRYRDEQVSLAMWAMGPDQTLAAEPIHRPVTSNQEIEASFDNGITYAKGSSILRAAEALVGRDRWREFIRGYVRAHAWGNASKQDFVGELRGKLGDQAADLIETYVSRPGVPLVKVTADCTGEPRLTIDEPHRALPQGVVDPKDRAWSVPVCVRFGDAKHAERACGTPAEPIRIASKTCPTWVIPNADGVGYYRSVVDARTVAALFDPRSAIAKAAKPTATEKMMAIGDLRGMIDRGELEVDVALKLAPAILADADPLLASWSGTAGAYRYDMLDDRLYLASEAWFATVYGKTARSLGWQRAKTDSDDRHKLRQSMMWRLGRRDPQLRAEADKLATRWLADRTGLDDDLVSAVLYAAVSHGDEALFDKVLAAAKSPRDRAEAGRLLTTLGQFTDPKLARRALELGLSNDFDARESIRIMYGQINARETRELALAFLTDHLDALLARMRDDEAAGFLGFLAGSACDPARKAAITALVNARSGRYDGAKNYVAQGLEQSQQCIDELARERPALERFLARYAKK
jgi:aminopeptidase N